MKWSTALVAAWVGSVAAHGSIPGLPKVVGGRKFMAQMRAELNQRRREAEAQIAEVAREVLDSMMTPVERDAPTRAERAEAAVNSNGQCGAGFGSCATGYCCSPEGWCGVGTDYCSSPDCQINYGPACDGNQQPAGAVTSNVARTKLGSQPYGGSGIVDCVEEGVIALTFDDGPYNFTGDLLDKLKHYGVPATFMITGNNLGKGQINDASYPWSGYIKRMIAEGHQVCSHSWSHQNYSQLTTAQFKDQIYWNEIALNDILGFFPTYWRPPYSICPASCESTLATAGYHIVYFDLDTEGYLNDSPTLIQNSKNIWDETVDGTNPKDTDFLLIEHDIHYQTVYNLTDYIIQSLFANGYKAVTLGECLGDAPANWYRAGSGTVPSAYTSPTAVPTETNPMAWAGNADPPAASGPTSTTTVTAPTAASTDGTCGNGFTCSGSTYGPCCSTHGYCGNTTDFCGTGCQSAFGTCSAAAPSSTGTSGGLTISTDSSCGNGVTCAGSTFGTCCSANGYCGSTSDYCGTGCQAAFGSCGTGSSSSLTTTTTTTTTTTSKTTTTTSKTTTTTTTTTSTTTTTTTTTRPTTTTTTTTTTRPTTTTTTHTTTTTTTTKKTTTSVAPPPPANTGLTVSTNGNCGAGTGETCEGSSFGPCCGGGVCGVLECLSSYDCDPNYGLCLSSSLSGSSGSDSGSGSSTTITVGSGSSVDLSTLSALSDLTDLSTTDLLTLLEGSG